MNIMKIAEFLSRQKKPVTTVAIIEGAGVSQTAAYVCLKRLVDEGLAVSCQGASGGLRSHILAPGVSIDDVRRALDIDGKPHTPFGQLGVQARDVFDFAAKLGGAAVGGV